MPVYKRLAVKDIPFFKSAELDLATPGITVVLGLNTNDPAKHASKNTNFVGKSLLLSQIPDIAFRDGLGGKAKDKARRGERILEVTGADGDYSIRHYYKGATEYLQIHKDGVDVTPTSQTAQRALVCSVLGRDELSYQVLDYLDNTKPHPLRVGDTGKRREFFTRFFQLASADHMRRLVDAEKDSMKQAASQRQALQTHLDSLRVPADCSEELAAAKKKAENLTRKLDAMREDRDQFRWRSMNAEGIEALRSSDVQSVDDVEATIEVIRLRGVKLKKQVAAIRDAREARAAYNAYRKAVAAREAYIAEHDLGDVDPKALRARIQELDRVLSDAADSAQAAADKRARYAARVESLSDALVLAEQAHADFQSKSKTCSRCGQPLTAAHREAEQKTLADDVRKATRALREFTSDAPPELSAAPDLRKVKAELRRLREQQDLLQDAPSVPERVSKPEADATGDEDTLLEQLAALRQKKAALDSLLLDTDQLTLWIESRGGKLSYDDDTYDKLQQAVLTCQATLSELSLRSSEREQVKAQRAKLRKDIQGLDVQLTDYDAVLLLEKAFASNANGIKSMVIRGLCEALESQVNRYASFLFPEDYTFKFDLDTQFEITVTRRFGKTGLTSDVRKLSGAEAGLFNLLLVVALTTFLPATHRSNLLVLDEVDANFSPAMTEAFIRFLPVLNKAIPHIIVITPKDADYGEAARYVTVVKRGAVSRLFSGRPAAVAQRLARSTKGKT